MKINKRVACLLGTLKYLCTYLCIVGLHAKKPALYLKKKPLGNFFSSPTLLVYTRQGKHLAWGRTALIHRAVLLQVLLAPTLMAFHDVAHFIFRVLAAPMAFAGSVCPVTFALAFKVGKGLVGFLSEEQ